MFHFNIALIILVITLVCLKIADKTSEPESHLDISCMSFQHKTVFRDVGTCCSVFVHTLSKCQRNTDSHQKLVLLSLASLLLSISFAPEPNPKPVNDGSTTTQQSSCSETTGQWTSSGSDHHTPSSPSLPCNCGIFACDLPVS